MSLLWPHIEKKPIVCTIFETQFSNSLSKIRYIWTFSRPMKSYESYWTSSWEEANSWHNLRNIIFKPYLICMSGTQHAKKIYHAPHIALSCSMLHISLRHMHMSWDIWSSFKYTMYTFTMLHISLRHMHKSWDIWSSKYTMYALCMRYWTPWHGVSRRSFSLAWRLS